MEAETITVVDPPYSITDCYDYSTATNVFPPIFEGLVACMVMEESVVVDGDTTQTMTTRFPEQDHKWHRAEMRRGLHDWYAADQFASVEAIAP